MGRWKKGFLLLLMTVFALGACTSYDELAAERERRAKSAVGDIRIALVWQKKLASTYFFEGAQLAVEEINNSGGVLGRKFRTIRYCNDSAKVEKDRRLAQHIVADCDITAVIGHYTEEGAIAASVTYEYGGLLYIAPAATSIEFSKHGFNFVFRNTLSDRVNGVQLADLAKKRGYTRVLVLDDRMVYGKGLADIFYAAAAKIGIEVVARRSYDSFGKDFKPLFARVKKLNFDAVFLAGSMPTAGEVIRQARIMGITVPFIGGNNLNVPNLWRMAGAAAEGTITPTLFHHAQAQAAVQAFSRTFAAKYGADPDSWAALGYDAVGLLADAFRKGGSTAAVVAASHLRFMEGRRGVLGTYSFMKNGNILGNINKFQVLHNGRFELLEDTLP